MSSWFIRRANVVYSAGGRLPAGFTELEYIQGSGSQYIDTGIYPTQNIEVELRSMLLPTLCLFMTLGQVLLSMGCIVR